MLRIPSVNLDLSTNLEILIAYSVRELNSAWPSNSIDNYEHTWNTRVAYKLSLIKEKEDIHKLTPNKVGYYIFILILKIFESYNRRT